MTPIFFTGIWPQLGSSLERSALQRISKSPGFCSPTMSKNLFGLASILHPQSSTSISPPIGKDSARRSQMDCVFSSGNTNCGAAFVQSLSFPECNLSPYSRTAFSFGASSSNGSGFKTLSGSQFFQGSPKLYSEPSNFSSLRGRFVGHHLTTNDQSHGFLFTNQGPFSCSSQGHQQLYHCAGSAPSGCPFERRFGFYQEDPRSFMKPSFGGVGYVHNDRNQMMNLSGCGRGSLSGTMPESGSSGFGSISSPGFSSLLLGNSNFSGIEGFTESGRGKRVESIGNQMDLSKQFQLDLAKIRTGEDTRTTLMIKNIPNKYTSKMLLAAIDKNHRGTYDFLYLPIDFNNKCNVGYAFINMLSPSNIIPFYEAFNGKKWEKFNSEKVACLAFARIQGKAALVSHFQNSSLMNEDKRCRPILLN